MILKFFADSTIINDPNDNINVRVIFGYPSIIDGIERDTLRIELDASVGLDEVKKMFNKKYVLTKLYAYDEYIDINKGGYDSEGHGPEHPPQDPGGFPEEHLPYIPEGGNNETIMSPLYTIGEGYTIVNDIRQVRREIKNPRNQGKMVPKEYEEVIIVTLNQMTYEEWEAMLNKYKNSSSEEEVRIWRYLHGVTDHIEP